jgi:tetratricopeptide (TPR) repeat protein
VSQKVGLTDIDVAYHRPAVKGRKVWGGLVPYGKVWRAGANENTVVTFSTPVTVGGVALPAGRYGLHILPTATEWTVIFSEQSHAWGSFSYDPKEDVARLRVTPVATEPTERLAYTFDDPTEKGVTLSLRWEKLRVPIPIEVDTKQVVVQSLREQLRGLPRFFPEGWSAAAGWCVRNDVNLEEAQAWVDRSLTMRETYPALRTKAALLEKKGDTQGAEALRTRALAIATEVEINQAGYNLLGQNKVDEAIALFRRNVQEHPDSWNTYDSLAEAYALKGDKAQAVTNYQRAFELVKQEDQRARIQDELAKLK